MKIFVVLAAFVTLLFASLASVGTAQESPYDPGEQNVLNAACKHLWNLAESQQVLPTACRRAAPEKVNEWQAEVSVDLYIKGFLKPLQFVVNLYKTPWTLQNLESRG